jgi:hypothetical protein
MPCALASYNQRYRGHNNTPCIYTLELNRNYFIPWETAQYPVDKLCWISVIHPIPSHFTKLTWLILRISLRNLSHTSVTLIIIANILRTTVVHIMRGHKMLYECSSYGQAGLAIPVMLHILHRKRFIFPILNPKRTFIGSPRNLALQYYLYLVLVHILHTFCVTTIHIIPESKVITVYKYIHNFLQLNGIHPVQSVCTNIVYWNGKIPFCYKLWYNIRLSP